MMHTKIDAAERLPTLFDAVIAMDEIAGDLGDINALMFALSHPSDDWEFDRRTLRAAWLAIEQVRATAERQRGRFELARECEAPLGEFSARKK